MAYKIFPAKKVFVDSLQDLPAPVGNVITLVADTAYHFVGPVNLGGNRLVLSNNVSLIGDSLNSCSITSALPASERLITSTGQIQITSLGLNVSGTNTAVFDLDGIAAVNGKCLLREVIIVGSGIGTIKNYAAFLLAFSIFASYPMGLTMDGANGIVIFDTVQMTNTVSGVTSLTFPATYASSIRTRILASGLSAVSGATNINIDTGVTVSAELFIINEVIFSGAGTMLTGMDSSNSKAFYSRNSGIRNSFNSAYYYMTNNPTNTVIANTVDFVKVAGTTTPVASRTQRFNLATANRAIYTGTITRTFRVTGLATMSDGNNATLMIRIAKNGVTLPESEAKVTTSGAGASENINVMTLVELATNDYIEIFVRNSSAVANILVSDLAVIVETAEE